MTPSSGAGEKLLGFYVSNFAKLFYNGFGSIAVATVKVQQVLLAVFCEKIIIVLCLHLCADVPQGGGRYDVKAGNGRLSLRGMTRRADLTMVAPHIVPPVDGHSEPIIIAVKF